MKDLTCHLKNILCIDIKCIKGKKMRDSQRAGTGDFLGPSVAAWELSPDLFTPSLFPQLGDSSASLPSLHYLCNHCERLHNPGRSLNQHQGPGRAILLRKWNFHLSHLARENPPQCHTRGVESELLSQVFLCRQDPVSR